VESKETRDFLLRVRERRRGNIPFTVSYVTLVINKTESIKVEHIKKLKNVLYYVIKSKRPLFTRVIYRVLLNNTCANIFRLGIPS